MKTNLSVKILSLIIILNFQFSMLNCSAQPYSVYSCSFANWTGGKPDGWSFGNNNVTVSQYTPAYSGDYACKIEAPQAATMTSKETFPMYWGKKYILTFAAKLIQGHSIVEFSISNPDVKCHYLKEQVEIDTAWKVYEIEFTSEITSSNSYPTSGMPVSCFGNILSISVRKDKINMVEFVIDNIKLIAVDNTMEFNYLEANNLKAYIDPIAPFLRCSNDFQSNINFFEAPKNSGKFTTYGSNIWLGAIDELEKLHLAAQIHCIHGRDFYIGPLTNDYEVINDKKTVSDAYIQKYHHTWKVTKEEIEYHKAHYADTHYVMPLGIANWPAHGRTQYGEDDRLAPYKNVSGTGGYTPWLGDYPEIRGDEAVYFITNDGMGEHTESSGTPLGVNVLGMAYCFNSPDSALNNTIFLSYVIKNSSLNHYRDFYFGFRSDFEIGFGWDDYVGCDTLLNLAYGYNATEIDAWGYGEHPPAQGTMFLNQKMTAFGYQNNGSPSLYSPPKYDTEYYNILQGKWRDGDPITYGGTGYNLGSTEITPFAFSGDPVTATGWSELTPYGQGSEPNTPGDRYAIISAGPFTLPAGGSICFDIALPFARDYQGDHISSVALLKQRALAIQQFYNNQNFENNCSNTIGIKENTVYNDKLLIYPNPSQGQFTVTCEKIIESIVLYDMLGKKVFEKNPKVQTIQIDTHLPQGLYIYRVGLQDNTIRTGKIMVQ